MEFLARGGPLFLPSDDAYVDALIDLANQPPFEQLVQQLSTPTASIEEVFALLEQFDGKKYQVRHIDDAGARQALVDQLVEILEDPAGAYRRHEAEWLNQLRGRVLTVHTFGGANEERRIVADGETARIYVFRLLTHTPYDTQLRRCRRSSCAKFFLDRRVSTGSKLEYCSKRCSKDGALEKLRLRAQRQRERAKLKKLHSHALESRKDK